MSVERAGKGESRWHSMNLRFGGGVFEKFENRIEPLDVADLQDADFFSARVRTVRRPARNCRSSVSRRGRVCPAASSCLAMSKCVVVGVTMFSASLAAAASAMEAKTCSLCLAAILRAVSALRIVNAGEFNQRRRRGVRNKCGRDAGRASRCRGRRL